MKIVISGTTGVGKSTTVNLLKSKLEQEGKTVEIVGELVADSPYFDLYFNDLSEWGFVAQLDFLLERTKQFMIIEEKRTYKDPNHVVIFDRTWMEDLIFAELYWVRQNTSAFLTNAYRIIYNHILELATQFDKVDHFILLEASYDTVKLRMNKRGRSQETIFHDKYWKDLYWRYYNDKKYKKIFTDFSENMTTVYTDDIAPDKVVQKIIKKLGI